MSIIRFVQKTSLFCVIFLMVLAISCSVQDQSSKENENKEATEAVQEIPNVNQGPYIVETVDASQGLRFSSGIRSILEDSKGNIWIGSHQEGLCLYDGKTMSYYTVQNGLCDNQIRSIYEDDAGVVWFEGGRDISSYDGEKMITHKGRNYATKNEWELEKNDLWFKGNEMIGHNEEEAKPGVYRYNGNNLTYLEFPPLEQISGGFAYSISTPFVRGKNDRVWFGTYSAVIGYDGHSFNVIDNKRLGFNKDKGFLHVRSIFEDSKGNLWIGNNGIGVLLHDGDTTINFSMEKGLMSTTSLRSGGFKSPPKTLEHVFSIGEDRAGNMWFGDRDTGAWRYDGKTMKNYTRADGLTTMHIWQIYLSKNGALWFAMGDGQILKFNGTSFEPLFNKE